MREERLAQLIEDKKYLEIKKEMEQMNEVDIAHFLNPLEYTYYTSFSLILPYIFKLCNIQLYNIKTPYIGCCANIEGSELI